MTATGRQTLAQLGGGDGGRAGGTPEPLEVSCHNKDGLGD